MSREEAIFYLEHTGRDDFNLEEWQIQNRLQAIEVIINKNKQLESNWNELKKWLEEKDNKGYEKIYLEDVLDKMQELESKDD